MEAGYPPGRSVEPRRCDLLSRQASNYTSPTWWCGRRSPGRSCAWRRAGCAAVARLSLSSCSCWGAGRLGRPAPAAAATCRRSCRTLAAASCCAAPPGAGAGGGGGGGGGGGAAAAAAADGHHPSARLPSAPAPCQVRCSSSGAPAPCRRRPACFHCACPPRGTCPCSAASSAWSHCPACTPLPPRPGWRPAG